MRHYASGSSLAHAGQGAGVADLAKTIGADVLADASGRGNANFADAMLRAVDNVSQLNIEASSLAEAAFLDPASVDIQDVTIAQAKASMNLNIAKNVLNRLVQDWKEIINIR
jgi:flagellar hook-basal body complex protein FliE